MRKLTVGLFSVFVAASLVGERDAAACGGCFAPPGPSTQVSAHRMAFAVSAKRTVPCIPGAVRRRLSRGTLGDRA